ncbi:hypothetical protein DFJ74DRAFT_602627 [Hyaloraphidium curvatum]|nr:hypothetical protein DFJ74DRAFT_602627 [Hyaloraphidium curvatum]
MKAIVLQRSAVPKGQPRWDPAPVTTVPRPSPRPNHVLVRIHASALNRRDMFIREGLYPGIRDGWILGADASGTIVEGGTRFKAGQPVYFNPSVAPRWGLTVDGFGAHGNGTLTEYICVHEDIPFPMPDHLSFEQASAVPLAGLTAWHAIVLAEIGAPDAKGKRVLVPGIGGGVAVFAMQFLDAMGAEVWVTSGSEEKLARAKELGAKGGVNYRNASWVEELERQLPKGGGFDAVIDGSSGPNTKAFMRLCREGAKIVVYGAVAGAETTVTMPWLWLKELQLRGSVLGSRKEYEDMDLFIKNHKLRPVVSRVFDGLENAEAAFEEMRKSTQFGKLVVRIAGDGGSGGAKL